MPSTNPYAPPGAATHCVVRSETHDPGDPPLETYSVGTPNTPTERALEIRAARIDLGPNLKSPHLRFTHDDFLAHVDIALTSFADMLIVRAPSRESVLLRPPAAAAVRRWIEPRLREYLVKDLTNRVRFGIPVGAFLVLCGWIGPTPDYGLIAYGVALALLSLVGPRMPHRNFFLVDALLWVLFAGRMAYLLARAFSAFDAVLLVLALLSATTTSRSYRFYGPAQSAGSG